MNLGDLKTEVFSLMRDTGKTKYSEAQVEKRLNYAERLLCSRLACYEEADTSITTDAGVTEYDLPSDFGEETAVYLGSGKLTKMAYAESKGTYTGTPRKYYTRNSNKIGLWGTVAGGDTLTIYYNSIGGVMTADANEPYLPKKYQMALVYYACYVCGLEGDDTRRKDFASAFSEITGFAIEQETKDYFDQGWPEMGDLDTDTRDPVDQDTYLL